MASGTISLGTSGKLKGRIVWSSTSNGSVANTSTVTAKIQAARTDSYGPTTGTWSGNLNIDGTNKSYSKHASINDSWVDLYSFSKTVAHQDSGAGTCYLQGKVNGPSGTSMAGLSVSGSKTVTLDTIPRYATVSQSLGSKTETTAVIRWTSDSTIDYVWYSIDNGTSWTLVTVAGGKSGTYTISGLSANTTYQVKTRVKREDSQLTTDSSALSVTTLNYPYCNSMPDFIIGNALALGFYNPLNRLITVTILGDDNSEIGSWTGTNVVAVGFNDSNSIYHQYASIPNSKSGTYKVKVVYGPGTSTITNVGGTYSINENVCIPEIGAVTYQDTNSTTLAVTGNNQQIIRNQSIAQFTGSGLTTKNSATIASATLSVNGNSYNLTVSGTSATGVNATIDSSIDVTAILTLTDSRGLQTTKEVEVTMLDWYLPKAEISLQRLNNFYSETNINVNAIYASLDNKNTITITYRYKKVSDTNYSSWVSIQDGVTATVSLDNKFEWNVQINLTDEFGTTTYNLLLPKGVPIIYFDILKNSTGFNCFPQDNESVEINEENILTRIAGYGEIANQVYGDWDTACGTASGFYMGVDLSNAPTSGWWYVLHIVHNNLYQRQIAFSFANNKEVYTRLLNAGTWSNWSSVTGSPKLLWTNSSPSSSFAAQTITLSSDDYDLLKIFYKKTDSENNLSSVEIIKGYDTDLGYIDDSCVLFSRHMESATDTSIEFDGASRLMPGSATTVADNSRCIPVYIVGYKSDLF